MSSQSLAARGCQVARHSRPVRPRRRREVGERGDGVVEEHGPEAADDDVVGVGVEAVGLGVGLEERDGVVLCARWRARSSIGSDRSRPVAVPGVTASAAARVVMPQPQPTSSTSSPGGELGGGEERLGDRGEHGVAPVGVGDPAVAALAVPGVLLGSGSRRSSGVPGASAGGVGVQALAQGVDGEAAGPVGEQPAATGGERLELLAVDPGGRPGEERVGGAGHELGGVVHRGQQRQDGRRACSRWRGRRR